MIKTLLEQEDQILREVRQILSAYQSVRSKDVVYASAPITSGKRLYAVMSELQVKTVQEVKDVRRFDNDVLIANLNAGRKHVDSLTKSFPCSWCPIINPGEFFSKGWAQEHYMSLWRQVIERHATIVAFAEDWQYSNGCAEEFLIAIQSHKMIAITYKDGADLIRKAIEDIDQQGFDVKPLYEIWRQISLRLEK